jgi:hypothetical protein
VFGTLVVPLPPPWGLARAPLLLLLLLRCDHVQVLLDLKEECGKHGQVYEVKVPRPANPKAARHLFGTGNYGKVGCVRLF